MNTDADSVPSSDEREDWLWEEQDALQDRVQVSASYHAKRERFLGAMERLFQAVAAVTATSAYAGLVDVAGQPTGFGKWFALAAAIASIAPLVFGLVERARQHGQLKSDFKTLLADMYQAESRWSESQLFSFKSRVAKLEAGEPQALAALVIQCQNELATSRGRHAYPLDRWEKFWMHLYSFDASAIVKRTPKPRTS